MIAIPLTLFGQVGIQTTNPRPNSAVHIDGMADNNNLPSNATDDFVIMNNGRIGIGGVAPNASVHIFTQVPNGSSPIIEGVSLPNISRERAASMDISLIPKGTMVYITDLSGSNTGSVEYVDEKGVYYFTEANKWGKLVYNATNPTPGDTREKGVNLKKVVYEGIPDNANTAQILTCGRFKIRIVNENNTYRVQMALAEPATNNITIGYSYKNVYTGNSFDYTTGQSSINIGGGTVFSNLSNNSIPTEDIHTVYITYPGDNDFYKFVVYRIEGQSFIDDVVNYITCRRY